jgi:cytochrome P450
MPAQEDKGVCDVTAASDLYYDPYDFEIDNDPYPIWKRMRDESPLYYNEKYDFYAVSRFEDVERCMRDMETYTCGRTTILELIQANIEVPPGMILFEDPPIHSIHRSLLGRVFTPKKMNAIEPKIREFCRQSLESLAGAGGFDFIRDVGAQVPMRAIGYLLGIPEEDQQELHRKIVDGLKLESGSPDPYRQDAAEVGEGYAQYIDWRAEHPSDDLMTELMTAEFEDETGTRRRLSREELLGYTAFLAAAGNETTTNLIGWTGKVLAEHPDQRREIAQDRSLVAKAIEELLRYESPSPVQSRYVARDVELYDQTVSEGSAMVLLNGSANRDERRFTDADSFDIHREVSHHLSFGYGIHFCLGAALARLEGRVVLDEVLSRFPDWEIDWENAAPTRTSTVRGWNSLPVFTS